jgi:predicted enzyme related to lactoylglutathione lyase
MDLRFEVAVIPVSDVDRAKAFYEKLGWRLDADATAGDSFRIVQFTPPGSECSVQFGTNMTSAAPGSAQGLYLIVSDLPAARGELAARGAEVSEVRPTRTGPAGTRRTWWRSRTERQFAADPQTAYQRPAHLPALVEPIRPTSRLPAEPECVQVVVLDVVDLAQQRVEVVGNRQVASG